MNKVDNIVIFVNYLNDNNPDDVIKFNDLSLAKDKFYEIEKENKYSYLELGVDNVESPTEGTYDILETYNISNLKNVINDRYKNTLIIIKDKIKEEISSNEELSKIKIEESKLIRDITNFLLKNELPSKIENNLSSELLNYKNFKIKQLFNESELKLLLELNINLNQSYSINLEDINNITLKLKNNEIIEVL